MSRHVFALKAPEIPHIQPSTPPPSLGKLTADDKYIISNSSWTVSTIQEAISAKCIAQVQFEITSMLNCITQSPIIILLC